MHENDADYCYRCARCLSVSLSVSNAPNDPAQRIGLETRLHCAGSFGAAFVKLLRPLVSFRS